MINKILDLPGSENKDVPRRRYIVTQNMVVDGIALLANDIVMATDADYADLSARYPGTLVALKIERDPNRELDAKLHQALHPGHAIDWKPAWFDGNEEQWTLISSDNAWPYVESQPCFGKMTHSGEVFWDVVPFYSTDHADAWEAESFLPERVRLSVYPQILSFAVVDGWPPGPIEGRQELVFRWELIHATPAMRVKAMLEALE